MKTAKYKDGDVVVLTTPDGERVTLYACSQPPDRIALALATLDVLERNANAGPQCSDPDCADCYALAVCEDFLNEAKARVKSERK